MARPLAIRRYQVRGGSESCGSNAGDRHSPTPSSLRCRCSRRRSRGPARPRPRCPPALRAPGPTGCRRRHVPAWRGA